MKDEMTGPKTFVDTFKVTCLGKELDRDRRSPLEIYVAILRVAHQKRRSWTRLSMHVGIENTRGKRYVQALYRNGFLEKNGDGYHKKKPKPQFLTSEKGLRVLKQFENLLKAIGE